MTDRQLFEAVEGGDCEKVKRLLLSRRVDVNQAPRRQVIIFFSSSFYHYPLWWWFCVSLCVCWVAILIWKFWEKKGFTPLMRACEKGDLKMITLLIENGASLESPPAEVFFSFFFSFFWWWVKVWWLIVSVVMVLKDGSDPLISACEFGNLEIAQFLFEKGSSLLQSSVNHFSLFFSSHFSLLVVFNSILLLLFLFGVAKAKEDCIIFSLWKRIFWNCQIFDWKRSQSRPNNNSFSLSFSLSLFLSFSPSLLIGSCFHI